MRYISTFVALMIVALIVVIIAVLVMKRMIRIRRHKRKKGSSAIIRIFLDFVQTVSLLSSLRYTGPATLSDTTASTSSVSDGASADSLPLQCALNLGECFNKTVTSTYVILSCESFSQLFDSYFVHFSHRCSDFYARHWIYVATPFIGALPASRFKASLHPPVYFKTMRFSPPYHPPPLTHCTPATPGFFVPLVMVFTCVYPLEKIGALICKKKQMHADAGSDAADGEHKDSQDTPSSSTRLEDQQEEVSLFYYYR